MIVNEIFSSIEGEGKRQGQLCTFIRLAGCNLRCSYCDTIYSQHEDAGTGMLIYDIVKECERLNNMLITVTGGEPLIHQNIEELIDELADREFQVNIETNGSILLPMPSDRNIFYTMDYKPPSSGEEDKMLAENLWLLKPHDILKFVVGSIEDLNTMKSVIQLNYIQAQIYISPVWGKIDMKDIVEFMKDNNLQNCKLQVQLHKIIYPADMRGV